MSTIFLVLPVSLDGCIDNSVIVLVEILTNFQKNINYNLVKMIIFDKLLRGDRDMLFEREVTNLGRNMIEVSDGENSVVFITDNKREIDAIRQYFVPIWDCKSEINIEESICTINSHYICNYNEVCAEIPFRYKKNIFYDLQGGYIFENERYYVVMREHKKAITIYDKSSKNIIFLRGDNEIQNIHLSQLIKEPLNLIKKANGYVQLHCSVCEYNGSIIVFPAQKGAGKTTLLMGMLGKGCQYLGNDSLFVKAIDGKIRTKINPHAIRLGIDTVENNFYLKRKLQDRSKQIKYRMIYNDLIINNKIQIVPSSLKDIFSEKWIGSDGEIRCIVFPHMLLSLFEYSIVPIEKEMAIMKLSECIKNADHRICWLPFFQQKDLEEIERESVLKICEALPSKLYDLVYAGDGLKAAELVLGQLK